MAKDAENNEINVTGSAESTDDEPKTGRDEEAELVELLEGLEAADRATLRVYRQPGRGIDKMEWLFTQDVEGLSFDNLMERIRIEYGGGSYRIQVRKQDGSLMTNKAIRIGEPLRAGAVEKPAQSGSPDLAAVVSQFRDISREQGEQLARVMEKIGQRPDTLSMLKEALAVAPLVLDLIGKLKGKTQPSPLDQYKEFLEFEKLVEKRRPDGDGDNKLWETAIEQLGQLIAHGKQAEGSGPSQHMTRQENPAMQKPPPQRVPQGQPHHPMYPLLRQLLAHAAEGADPVLEADALLDNLPSIYHPKLLDFLDLPDWFAQICAILPQAEQYAEWLTALREAVFAQFMEPDDTGDDGQDLTGDQVTSNDSAETREPSPTDATETGSKPGGSEASG